MIGLVIGSSGKTNKEITNTLIPSVFSIGVNRAAIDFNVDIATTSESAPIREWLQFGTSAKKFLINEKYSFLVPSSIKYTPFDEITFDFDTTHRLFYGHRNSALPAIHYLIIQGCKTILLSGITFEPNWDYYHLDVAKHHEQSHCDQIRQSLYELSEFATLISINQNSFNPKFVQTVTSEDILMNIVSSESNVNRI